MSARIPRVLLRPQITAVVVMCQFRQRDECAVASLDLIFNRLQPLEGRRKFYLLGFVALMPAGAEIHGMRIAADLQVDVSCRGVQTGYIGDRLNREHG